MKRLFLIFTLSLFCLNFWTLAADTSYYTFSTSDIGGVWFAEGATLSTQWNAEISDVQFSCDTRGGGTSNALAMATGRVDLAINNAAGIKEAMDGAGFFADKGPQDFSNVRSLLALHSSYLQIVVRADSDMEYLGDLRGKRVAVGQPGQSCQSVLPSIFKALGWDYDSLKKEYIGDYDAFDALRDGRIDAYADWIGLGAGVYLENFELGGFKILKMKKENMEKVYEDFSFFIPGELPAGTYKGQEEAIPVPYSPDFITVQANLPEDLVYQMCKVVYNHLNDGTLAATHVAFKEVGFPGFIEKLTMLPLHPGAKKFYQEIGVELEK